MDKAKRPLESDSNEEPVEQPEKRVSDKKRPIHWRDFDPALVNAGIYKPAQNGFGYNSQRSYGTAREPVLIACPDARVVFAPSVWDEAAEAAHGKPGMGKLKEDRKTDKWSMTLQFDNKEFIDMINKKLTPQIRKELFDSRGTWGKGQEDLEGPSGLSTYLKSPLQINKLTGLYEMKVTMRSERGSHQPNAAWFDFETDEAWDTEKKPIGKETLVRSVIDFSDVFAGAVGKVYASGRSFYVKEYVAPRVIDPSHYTIDKNRD